MVAAFAKVRKIHFFFAALLAMSALGVKSQAKITNSQSELPESGAAPVLKKIEANNETVDEPVIREILSLGEERPNGPKNAANGSVVIEDQNKSPVRYASYYYNKQRIAGSKEGFTSTGLYYNPAAPIYETINVCTFLEVNFDLMMKNITGISDFRTNGNFGGGYAKFTFECSNAYPDIPYNFIDYTTNTLYRNIYSENNTLTLEYHYDCTSYRNPSQASDGWSRFLIFHITPTPVHENLVFTHYSATHEIVAPEESIMSFGESVFQRVAVSVPRDYDGTIMRNRPLIVLVHGGGWEHDEELFDYYSFIYDKLPITYGYAAARIDYRPNTTLQNMLADLHTALCFIEMQYGEYVDMTNLALWGHSAGAHLCAFYCLSNYVFAPYPIKLFIDEAGAMCLDWFYRTFRTFWGYSSVLKQLAGLEKNASDRDLYEVISTINPKDNITRKSTYCVCVYSDGDGTIPAYSQSEFFDAMDNAGVHYHYYREANMGHNDYDEPSFDYRDHYDSYLRYYFG